MKYSVLGAIAIAGLLFSQTPSAPARPLLVLQSEVKSMAQEQFLKAVTSGDAAAVRAALDKDPALAAAADADGVSALLKALYYQKNEVAALLLERRTDLSVFEAAATGSMSRLTALLAKDASLAGATSPDGFSPLGLSCFFGQLDAAAALLAAGADPNAVSKNSLHVAPIHAAAAAGCEDIARLLLERGANANARQQSDFTALHEAARAGRLSFVKLLVDHGADVNAKSTDGRTPLSFALEGKHEDVAAYLTDHGARS
jgi:ankyrin repeat protein